MSQNPRIDELRRRVQADPASIAFAALAEEYRREGNFTDAIDTCVAGLKRHPSYLSAHVTLGRALIEVGRFEEAEQELQLVLKAAPENLAAIRGMAEIHHRRRDHGYEEASALSALQHHEHAEAVAAAQAAAPVAPVMDAPAEPPAYQPPAFDPPPFQSPVFEPAVFDPAPAPAAYEPAAYEPQPSEPPPAAPDSVPAFTSPAYEPPRYDPPGTFEFPQASATPAYDMAFTQPSSASPDYETEYEVSLDVAAYEAPAPVAEIPSPELDALERFLDAITASRTAIPAH